MARVLGDPTASETDRASVAELLEQKAWTELDDRFFRDIAFGTGGMRGRTMGKIITGAEKGKVQALERPEFPGTGTNMLNYNNVVRAVSALGAHLLETSTSEKRTVVIAHDTRYFSAEFAAHAAHALNALGIDALQFPEDRSTPQLSFTVRHARAQAGIMITASHNPPHDNGMKFYGRDGAQVVEPDASGITRHFQNLAAKADALPALLAMIKTQGKSITLTAACDQAYQDAVAEIVLEEEIIAQQSSHLQFVYTPLHGTGIRAIPGLLDRFGARYSIVRGQRTPDSRFPTVKSPNPENAEALALAMKQADFEGANVVMATDPDCDRMGVAVRDQAGKLVLLTGNQIGSILAYYRCERMQARGLLSGSSAAHAALIKTFVTTDLQKKIAEKFGVRCLETLTGFKYIGEKLLDYEKKLNEPGYDKKPFVERRAAALERGCFFIFGGEESYGYSGGDYVRDKDANAAVLMFVEAASWACSKGQTLVDYLDVIYRELGFYTERLGTLTFEGAQGAQKIGRLLASFRSDPPKTYQGQSVVRVEDFGKSDFHDADGKAIPKETMLLFHIADGGRMAVRGSGTEPKIKFYFFTSAEVSGDLETIKKDRRALLDAWWNEVQEDVKRRVET